MVQRAGPLRKRGRWRIIEGVSPPGVVDDWAEWLRTEDEENIARIRTTTQTDRPCGGKQFLVQLESLLARVLHPKKRGRKTKASSGKDAMEIGAGKEFNS